MQQQISPTVKHLLIINIIFFVANFAMKGVVNDTFAMYFPYNVNFKIWQPLSYLFMHGSLMHLFFNMFALYSFGSLLERIWGSQKFLFFYISCGFGAVLLHVGIDFFYFEKVIAILAENGVLKTEILALIAENKYNPNWAEVIPHADFSNFLGAVSSPMLGASGAIYGLMVAFAFMFPESEMFLMFIPFPVKAKYFVGFSLILDLFLGLKGQSIFGFSSTGIAHFAHIGGAVIGFLILWFWKKNSFNNKRLN